MRDPAKSFSISGNSSKVESAGRALVALVFLVALWFDPVQPVRTNTLGVALLTGFLAWSLVLSAVAWQSWWWDHRLARAAHAIDIAVFVGAVYYTEAPSTDFSSPFMAFAVLLLVKARIRWDWRATAWTAIMLLLLNFAIAGTMSRAGYAVDLQRVGRRTAYMMLLAVLLVWMGLERRVRLHLPFPLLPTPPEPGHPGEARHGAAGDVARLELLVSTALDFAREVVLARHAAIAWSAEQEPWINLGVRGPEPGDLRMSRLGPDLPGAGLPGADLPESDAPERDHDLVFATYPLFANVGGAVLFDSPRRRALAFGPGGQRIALRPERPPALAANLGVETGISVPITSDAGSGRLLFWDLADPGFDSLALAQAAAGEIGRAFEREERARLAQVVAVNGAVSGVREAIARDLHDSAAQFLAGTMFRLEALRRRMVGEPDPSLDPGTEIAAIKNAMRVEQTQLRNLIGQLRRGEPADRQTDLVQELSALLGELGTHWHLATTLEHGLEHGHDYGLDCGHDRANGPIIVPVTLSHEVRQLVREGVANAARHGGGNLVRVELSGVGAWLWLTISDNGRGFPPETIGADGQIALRPRSIAGRVAAMGGSLAISATEPHGATLSIGLPLRLASGESGGPVTGEDRDSRPASEARHQTASA